MSQVWAGPAPYWAGQSPSDSNYPNLNLALDNFKAAYSNVQGMCQDADYAELLTGIPVGAPPFGCVIRAGQAGGLAWVGTACRNDGYNTGEYAVLAEEHQPAGQV